MKQLSILSILLLSLLFNSCNDFLDKDPENKVPVENVDYTKTEDMFMPVSGIYAQARLAQGFSGWNSLGLIAVRGDDVEKGSAPNDQVEFNYCKKFEYDKITSYWALNAAWGNYYSLVATANKALEALAGYNEYLTNDSDKKLNVQYQAEVRFLRSYGFFFLTRLWGDVPLMLDNQELGIKKAPRADIYKFISDEMDFCIENLPALSPNEMKYKGQVTRYSAQALKAKANADINNWDAVLIATEDIINSGKFNLYPDFYQLFKKPGCLSEESLYELQYTDFGQGSGDIAQSDNWFAFQGPRSPMKGANGYNMNNGWGFMTPTSQIIDFFKSRGETVRYATTILYTNSITAEGDTIYAGAVGEPTQYSGKAYLPSTQLTPGRTGYGMGNNIRMIRYADVLLLNAEAKVRKGQNGDASLNLVRSRAALAPISNATLDNVLDERRAEFACEWGERYFDLIRTGKAKDVLSGFIEGESEFYPVPQNQIDLNPNLK